MIIAWLSGFCLWIWKLGNMELHILTGRGLYFQMLSPVKRTPCAYSISTSEKKAGYILRYSFFSPNKQLRGCCKLDRERGGWDLKTLPPESLIWSRSTPSSSFTENIYVGRSSHGSPMKHVDWPSVYYMTCSEWFFCERSLKKIHTPHLQLEMILLRNLPTQSTTLKLCWASLSPVLAQDYCKHAVRHVCISTGLGQGEAMCQPTQAESSLCAFQGRYICAGHGHGVGVGRMLADQSGGRQAHEWTDPRRGMGQA